ncbi:uncharacterized protein [Drosophila virilis]|uniref:Uncharacterized protein n=1 Tax=Drosophila virilis TaxID=7244 RepID=B4MG08_DROVI|nr:uncharacterized protein LOC6636554 [Drosophila virilis]EDW58269.2 uncharacterized protein Dvir_GJ15470 [Drosophila virilis]
MPTTPTPTTDGSAVLRRRQLLRSVESLRLRVRQVLNCVINLHIEFLVLESNVAALLDEVRSINDDYAEVHRLDSLIEALRNYNGPTICHEWPYPLIFKGTIDEAHVAQILNTTETVPESPCAKDELLLLQSGISASKMTRRSKLWWFTRTRSTKGTCVS